MKQFTVTSKKTYMRLAGVGLLLALLALPAAGAIATADVAPTNTVAQSYSAGPDVLSGMFVQPKDKSTVMPVNADSIHKMSGVVIPINGAQIVLTPPNTQSRQVLVSSVGRSVLSPSHILIIIRRSRPPPFLHVPMVAQIFI